MIFTIYLGFNLKALTLALLAEHYRAEWKGDFSTNLLWVTLKSCNLLLLSREKKPFVPRRSGSYPAFWFLKSHILQRNSLKIQRENWYFSFLHFLEIFFSCPMVFDPMDQFVWSIRFFWYPYWHTVWNFMSYGICHKMS